MNTRPIPHIPFRLLGKSNELTPAEKTEEKTPVAAEITPPPAREISAHDAAQKLAHQPRRKRATKKRPALAA